MVVLAAQHRACTYATELYLKVVKMINFVLCIFTIIFFKKAFGLNFIPWACGAGTDLSGYQGNTFPPTPPRHSDSTTRRDSMEAAQSRRGRATSRRPSFCCTALDSQGAAPTSYLALDSPAPRSTPILSYIACKTSRLLM